MIYFRVNLNIGGMVSKTCIVREAWNARFKSTTVLGRAATPYNISPSCKFHVPPWRNHVLLVIRDGFPPGQIVKKFGILREHFPGGMDGIYC